VEHLSDEELLHLTPKRPGAVAWLLGIARHQLLRSIERGRVEHGDSIGIGDVTITLPPGADTPKIRQR
jgi:hypothetical protein